MDEETDSRIVDFLQELRKRYNISHAIFFGSRAREEHLKKSDYDTVLVSEDSRDIFVSKRTALMYEFWQHWPIEIE